MAAEVLREWPSQFYWMLDRLGAIKGHGESRQRATELGCFVASLLNRRGCERAVIRKDLSFILAAIAHYAVLRERDDVMAGMKRMISAPAEGQAIITRP